MSGGGAKNMTDFPIIIDELSVYEEWTSGVRTLV
jgi:hypothetical protein